MYQRIPHQVQGHLISQRGHLLNHGTKDLRGYHFFVTLYRRTEAALQVADVADLDIDFVKSPLLPNDGPLCVPR